MQIDFIYWDLCGLLVVGVGFEPTKAKPADLQSAPFDRFGTPPAIDPGQYHPVTCPPRNTTSRPVDGPFKVSLVS